MKISNEFAEFFSSIGEKYSKNTPNSTTKVDIYLEKIKLNEKSIFMSPCNMYEI